MEKEGPIFTESLELIRLAQDGQVGALNDLLARYYERVRRVVRARLGPQLRSCLESGDILQETFIAAVYGFDGFEMRGESSLLRWLSQIAENQIRAAAAYHGAQRRDRRREEPWVRARGALDSGEVWTDLPASGPQPIELLMDDESRQRLDDLLSALRPDQREVILLRDYIGGSWKEVCEWTDGTSVDAVRLLHARALTTLAKLHRKLRS